MIQRNTLFFAWHIFLFSVNSAPFSLTSRDRNCFLPHTQGYVIFLFHVPKIVMVAILKTLLSNPKLFNKEQDCHVR